MDYRYDIPMFLMLAILTTFVFLWGVYTDADTRRLERIENRWDALKREKPDPQAEIDALRARVKALEDREGE